MSLTLRAIVLLLSLYCYCYIQFFYYTRKRNKKQHELAPKSQIERSVRTTVRSEQNDGMNFLVQVIFYFFFIL